MRNTILILKMNKENLDSSEGEHAMDNYPDDIFFCMGTTIDETPTPRMYDDLLRAKESWKTIFDDISPVRTEFYKRFFVVMYKPRIVSVDVGEVNLEDNIVSWGEISNPFFTMTLGELYPQFAEKLWNAGEPLFHEWTEQV